MTFLKREMLRKKPSLLVFGLVVAASVLFGGYVLFLAILAPEQLAEATTAATDLICDKCVGTTDIADGAVTSAKIGSGQVKTTDLGASAVTTTKIADGQVGNGDIAHSAVTSPKIADFQVGNGDLGTDAVTSAKIKDGQVGTADIANDAIKPDTQIVTGSQVTLHPGQNGAATAECPSGTTVTGGGSILGSADVRVSLNYPSGAETWRVAGFNESNVDLALVAVAVCIGPSP